MKKGDYVICEFGHNDQKEKTPGSGAWYNFSYNLKQYIDKVRAKGGNIIFVTPTQRRSFDKATRSKIQETHGDYPDAMRWPRWWWWEWSSSICHSWNISVQTGRISIQPSLMTSITSSGIPPQTWMLPSQMETKDVPLTQRHPMKKIKWE